MISLYTLQKSSLNKPIPLFFCPSFPQYILKSMHFVLKPRIVVMNYLRKYSSPA